MTSAGMVVGSLPYMAPEQLSGGAVSAAADVYGLGAVLYEMLARQRPYSAATPLALAEAQHAPPARVAGAPASLMDLALAALLPAAHARPTATAFAAAARGWDSGGAAPDAPTVAVPVRVAAAGASRGRRFAAILASVAVIALVAVLVTGAAPGPTPATEGLRADNIAEPTAQPARAANDDDEESPSGAAPRQWQGPRRQHRTRRSDDRDDVTEDEDEDHDDD